jgi:hypothetical protein
VGTEPSYPLSPVFGTAQTLITYSVTYTGTVTPSIASVYIDGTPYPLAKGSAYASGKVYRYFTTLRLGSHSY